MHLLASFQLIIGRCIGIGDGHGQRQSATKHTYLCDTAVYAHRQTFPSCIFVCRAKLVEAALAEMAGVEPEPRAEVARMLALQETYLACPDAANACDLCCEDGIHFLSCSYFTHSQVKSSSSYRCCGAHSYALA